MAVQTLEGILREQNPDWAKSWDGWEAKLKPKSFTAKGHRGKYKNFEGFIKMDNPEAYAKGEAALAALNAPKDTPAELPMADNNAVEDQVNKVTEQYVGDGTIGKPRRKRSSTILTGMNGDGPASPMVKRKSLLGSFSANG